MAKGLVFLQVDVVAAELANKSSEMIFIPSLQPCKCSSSDRARNVSTRSAHACYLFVTRS